MLKTLALLAAAASSGLAAVVKKDWNIEWVSAAPDGFTRPVIGINGQWPCPTLEANVGDKVVIQVTNKLENETTSLHWHGILQTGSTMMDGPAYASQCPITPGSSFTYEFNVDKAGTYWYHAHVGAQYSDGLRAPMIVHDKKDPNKDVDDEYILTVSDWYHDQVPELLTELFDPSNVNVRPPQPKSVLINDGKNTKYDIRPGKKYRFRIINMSALANAAVFFDAHNLKVVEIDGINTVPTDAEQIYITPGQRYSVIVEGKKDVEENHAINVVLDLNPEVLTPIDQIGFQLNATATLQYDTRKAPARQTTVDKFNVLDDFALKPRDSMEILKNPDRQVVMDFRVGLDEEGNPRAFFNNISYTPPKTPSLYTALTTGDDASDPKTYGQVNPFIYKKDEVIEVTLNNLTPGHHPFHLHGHHVQVLSRPGVNAGLADPKEEDYPEVPMRRDTFTIHGLSSAVFRFKADNPGVWLFHCHVEWHLPLGMVATFIEDPKAIQKSVKIPKGHLEVCKEQCLGTEGEAESLGQPTHGALYEGGECKKDKVDRSDRSESCPAFS